MKALTEKVSQTANNAWGRPTYSEHQDFEVELTDAYTTRLHFRGNNHSQYKFRRGDVGKVITVYTDRTGWTCWVFASEGHKKLMGINQEEK